MDVKGTLSDDSTVLYNSKLVDDPSSFSVAPKGISGFGTSKPTESIETSILSTPPRLNCTLKSIYKESLGALPPISFGGYKVTNEPGGA